MLLDEPVSALDVSVAAQVLNLLADLQQRLGLGYLLITHELPVARYLADQIVVMFAGHVVESGPAARCWPAPPTPTPPPCAPPRSPWTRRPACPTLPPVAPPATSGCPYATRCPAVMPRCRQETPPHFEVQPGRTARCFLVGDASPASGTPGPAPAFGAD